MVVVIMFGIAVLSILFYFGICHFIERYLRAKGWREGQDTRSYVFGGDIAKQWIVAIIVGMVLGFGAHIIWQAQAYELGIMIMTMIFLFFAPFGVYRLVAKTKRKVG